MELWLDHLQCEYRDWQTIGSFILSLLAVDRQDPEIRHKHDKVYNAIWTLCWMIYLKGVDLGFKLRRRLIFLGERVDIAFILDTLHDKQNFSLLVALALLIWKRSSNDRRNLR